MVGVVKKNGEMVGVGVDVVGVERKKEALFCVFILELCYENL